MRAALSIALKTPDGNYCAGQVAATILTLLTCSCGKSDMDMLEPAPEPERDPVLPEVEPAPVEPVVPVVPAVEPVDPVDPVEPVVPDAVEPVPVVPDVEPLPLIDEPIALRRPVTSTWWLRCFCNSPVWPDSERRVAVPSPDVELPCAIFTFVNT